MEQRSIDDPNERRPYVAHGHMDVVTLGAFTLGRGTFEPGWQWSKDIKPIAGTESCAGVLLALAQQPRRTLLARL